MDELFDEEISRITELISELDDDDGLKRAHAREELVLYVPACVPYLIKALSHQHEHVRWEAAKALQVIRDPAAATALVEMLNDEVEDVRWAAAEALVPLKKEAILPLMEALVEHCDSVNFRTVTHYVLRNLEKKHLLNEPVEKVYQALGEIEPEFSVPWAVEKALEELKHRNENIADN